MTRSPGVIRLFTLSTMAGALEEPNGYAIRLCFGRIGDSPISGCGLGFDIQSELTEKQNLKFMVHRG
jgi:hypothetical protein